MLALAKVQAGRLGKSKRAEMKAASILIYMRYIAKVRLDESGSIVPRRSLLKNQLQCSSPLPPDTFEIRVSESITCMKKVRIGRTFGVT